MKTALTIAGSDTSAGAGIQADLKTFSANGVYGQTVITALTAQNTMGVNDIFEVPDDFFRKEIDAVCTDIFPDAVKIGMVESSSKIKIISEEIEKYNLMHIVLDPLMISTTGHKLLHDEAIDDLCQKLFSKAELITPNIPEAEELMRRISSDHATSNTLEAEELLRKTGGENTAAGSDENNMCAIADGNVNQASNSDENEVQGRIDSEEKMRFAAEELSKKYNTNVLIKGGHFDGDPIDVLYEKNGDVHVFYGRRIENKDTHGTGCVLSSTIAANLAKGCTMLESVSKAREFLQGAIRAGLHLGHGNGPMDLFYSHLRKFFEPGADLKNITK